MSELNHTPEQAPEASAAPSAAAPGASPDPATAGDATAEILARLDAMSAQMAVMAEQVAAADATRERWAELMETMAPVSAGVMHMATEKLAELQQDVTLEDVSRFATTTVKAVPQMEVLVGQLGSFSELGREVTSLSGAAVGRMTELLQVAEDKGYFMFAREGAAIADKIVTTYSEQDVRDLGENIITIINAVKELTQPEVMALLNRTAMTIQQVEDTPMAPPSMLSLVRSMRDPQTRRGLARVLSMLHTVGEESPTTSAAPTTATSPTSPTTRTTQ
jgi:uncharacterized protein YjgD (DUF1641 family)